MVFFGLISFPLYLWHWPLLALCQTLESQTPGSFIRLSVLATSIILAWLTFTYIEKPIRHGSKKSIKSPILALSLMIIGCIGCLIWVGNGLEFRSPIKQSQFFTDQKIEQQFQEKCELPLKHIPQTHCAEINTGKPIILIVGDSHVRHWYEILKDKITADNFDVKAISKGGCPFLLDVAVPNVPDCIKTNSEILDYMIENKDNIQAVLMAGEYETYAQYGYLKDKYGKNVEFSRALLNTIGRVENQNLVFLDQIPPISFDPKKCINRPFRFGAINFECRTQSSYVRSALASYKTQRDLALADYKKVSIFNVDSILWEGNYCIATDGNFLLYQDRTHLNPNGVRFIKNKIPAKNLKFN